MVRHRWPLRTAAVSALAILLVIGMAPGVHAEQTIALSTGTVELALPTGGSASDTIAVANNGDEPLKALVYTNDVLYDDAGLPEYIKPTGAEGEYLKSPASWLSLHLPAETQVIANTPYIELAPGEEMLLDFELRVPAGAAPGDYNAIIFFEMFDDASAPGTSSKVSGRIGARVVVRVAGDVIEKLEVAPFWVRGLIIGRLVPYEFTFTNAGNVDKRYVPSLVVLDRSEAEITRKELEESAIVYAGNAREYSGAVELDRPLFGKYTLRAEMSYNMETAPGTEVPEVIREDRTFWIFPLWFAVLLLLVVALPVLWLLWRASTRGSRGRGSRRRAPQRRPRADVRPPTTGAEDGSAEP